MSCLLKNVIKGNPAAAEGVSDSDEHASLFLVSGSFLDYCEEQGQRKISKFYSTLLKAPNQNIFHLSKRIRCPVLPHLRGLVPMISLPP